MAAAALTSEIMFAAIKSAPKKTKRVEKSANSDINKKERAIIFLTDRADPKNNSSATRRVTAVFMPLVAKVAAKI